MKKIFFTFLLALMAITVSAVPAKKGLTKVLTLTDGTTVTAQLVGDEYGHYWLGENGKTYNEIPGGTLFQEVDGEAIKQNANKHRAKANQERMKKLAPKKVGTFGNYTGSKKGIILLVNFATDVQFASNHNNALFTNIANTPGYNLNGFKGSVHDYFYDQSGGVFDLTFDVAGPFTLAHDMAYYGQDIGGRGNDKAPGEMVKEALTAANPTIDFSQYDWDGDNVVDQVYVIYAGYGQADGGSSNSIWPHEWTLESATGSGVTMDNVYINTYACGSELQGSGGLAGIGTMCHEFSHCLGYPDFYDTNDWGDGIGMDAWDLMDYGSYNDNSFTPAGYTSYERWMAGWLEPIELLGTKTVTNMKGLQENGEAYIIYNDGNNNEYFLLENRKKVGWDQYIPGEGLLIIHVDYNESAWTNNTVNYYSNHKRMIYVPANNNINSPSGAAYPYVSGSTNNNTFSGVSTPKAQFFNNTSNGTKIPDWWSVDNITKSSGTKYISFNFNGLTLVETPVFSPEAGTFSEPQQITISCETEDAVVYYTTDGTDPTSESTQYSGPFTLSETATVKAIAIKDDAVSEIASARYVIHIQGEGTTYTKVFKNSNLKPGRKFVIIYEGDETRTPQVLNGISDTSTPYGLHEDVDLNTETNEAEVYGGEASVLTLDGEKGAWTFQLTDDSYLSWSSGNSLKTSESAYGWIVSVSEDGAVLKTGTRTLQYNISSPRFACYSSTQKKAYLYVEKTDDLAGDKDDAVMTFQPDNVSVELGAEFNAPVFTITPSGLPVTFSSSNPDVADVDPETGEVTIIGLGETVISAYFEGNDDYYEGTASYTLKVIEPVVGSGRYQLVTSLNDMESGRNYLIVSTEDDGSYVAWNGLGENSGLVGAVTIGDDDIIDLSVVGNAAQPVVLDYVETSSPAYWTIKAGDVYVKTVSTAKLGAVTTADGVAAQWTLSFGSSSGEANIKNRNNNNYLRYNRSADMFRVYSSGQAAIYLYKEITEPVVTEVTVTVSQRGAASFSSEYPLDFTDAPVNAYIVTEKNGSYFKKQQVTLVPANTGIIVEGAEGEYPIPVIVVDETTSAPEALEGNLLVATSTGEFTVGEFYGRVYGLFYSTSKQQICFQKKKADYTFPVNKCYLLMPEGATAAAELFFDEVGQLTAINAVETDTQTQQGVMYNLNGQKVNNAYKGVVIINGQKVIRK